MKRSFGIASLIVPLIGVCHVTLANTFTYNSGVFQTSTASGDCECLGFLSAVAYVTGPQVNNLGQVLSGNILYSANGVPLTGSVKVPKGPMNPGSNSTTSAFGLNDLGQIVGYVVGQDPVTLQSYLHGFSYLNGA
jgi:hypothetical protein